VTVVQRKDLGSQQTGSTLQSLKSPVNLICLAKGRLEVYCRFLADMRYKYLQENILEETKIIRELYWLLF